MTGGRCSTGLRKRHALQLFKTDMCKFFLQSRCENGDRCSYAHSQDEVRRKPDLTRTSMCRTMAQTGLCHDVTCRFAHAESELRATHGFFKMKMCGFAQSGRCKHGKSCRFAHSPEELRPAKPPPMHAEAAAFLVGTSPSASCAGFMPEAAVSMAAIQQHTAAVAPTGANYGPEALAALAVSSTATCEGYVTEEDQNWGVPVLPPGQAPAHSWAPSLGDGTSPWEALPVPTHIATQLMANMGLKDAALAQAPPPPLPCPNVNEVMKDRRLQRREAAVGGRGGAAPGGSWNDRQEWQERQDRNGRTERNERNESDSADGSSWTSGNSSMTDVPRSEHTGTGSPPTTSDSSSGGNGGDSGSGGAINSAGPSASTGVSGNGASGGIRERRVKTQSRRPLPQSGDAVGLEPKVTTLFITNIPTYLTQGALLSMFEDLNYAMRGNFDFFFCPWEEKAGQNKGWAIINFPDVMEAAAFQQYWSNKEMCRGGRGQKALRVIKAALQGLQANLEYFSAVDITDCSDPRFRPLFRDGSGILQPLQRDVVAAPWGLQSPVAVLPVMPPLPELPPSGALLQGSMQGPPPCHYVQERPPGQQRPVLPQTAAGVRSGGPRDLRERPLGGRHTDNNRAVPRPGQYSQQGLRGPASARQPMQDMEFGLPLHEEAGRAGRGNVTGNPHSLEYWGPPEGPETVGGQAQQMMTWPVMMTAMPWHMGEQEMHQYVGRGEGPGGAHSHGQGHPVSAASGGSLGLAPGGRMAQTPTQVPFSPLVPCMMNMMMPMEAMIPVEGGYVDRSGFHAMPGGLGRGAGMSQVAVTGGWGEGDEVYTD